MRKLFGFFRKHWYFLTHREFHSELTHEEFKKLWNENLEEMKME